MKEYVRQQHNANVPSRHTDESDFNLGQWVSNRRRKYGKRELSSDRIQQLETIEGWVWDSQVK
jgi:hypothetical protein